ncbi:MAG: folate/biopterin family MFS transporter [Woronichinia naegeliana WA131]|jgi:folate/biopterin transporter|uniref:Folate/biopterin family MFS transporter n=1 Tax=Woronichinia naegeliana WA131 TaxID=2824559 RepID=A0A977L077_9CYAN|nr:MAG: folate/biopterin family MFS transporter [Woronichinia naegeliana WA131]
MVVSLSALESFKKRLKTVFLFGNEPTLELFAILSVYFVQGILGLARLAVSFFLKDDLGLSPAQMGALTGIAAIPWIIKPLFGFLSDGLPLFGYRRRSYLILSGLLGSLSWLVLATMVNSVWGVTLTLLVTSLSVAVSDVIADSVVVERAQQESLRKAGSLQSLTWGTAALGGLITAYFSGLLLEQISTRTIFVITACFPLLVSFSAFLIGEEKPASPSLKNPLANTKNQLQQLGQTIRQKSILLPTIFIFLWQATPSADSAFFYFTTNELGFEPEFLGRVRLVTSLAGLIGIGLYQKFLKTIPFRPMLGWCTVISCLLGFTSLILVTHSNRAIGIDDHWFSLGDSLVLTVIGQVAFMPVLVLSARLCPKGIEATLFALLMSIWNLAGLTSQELGALLTHWLGVTETNFDYLAPLIIITNLTTLLPLLLLNWLPAGDPQDFSQVDADNRSFPSPELFEPHRLGTLADQSFLPEFMPDLGTPVKEIKSP